MAKGTETPGDIENLTDADILALIDAACRIDAPRKHGEVTILEMSAHWGVSKAAASGRLNRSVERGQMTRRDAVIDGKRRALFLLRTE
jgi:hypothetical protein